MLILDTDHMSALDRTSAVGAVLERRLEFPASCETYEEANGQFL